MIFIIVIFSLAKHRNPFRHSILNISTVSIELLNFDVSMPTLILKSQDEI